MNNISTQLGARSQRPTKLISIRNRSESPLSRSKSRPNEPYTQNGPESSLDLETLQVELERRSGVLNFGTESITAKMEDFIHEGLLGEGTCSVVYKMRHCLRPDFVMAVKYMRRTSTCPEENKRILMDLNVVTKSNDCSNIVTCFGIFFTTGDVWICMEVMPTCLDKLLRDLSRPFPERVVGKITVAITTALDYLKRKHNVMHRDVKPSNMLLSYDGIVKLCDFGISGMLKDSIARSRQLGCIGYMAPERLTTPTYDVRADIWSLGISLFELSTGSFPYKGTEIEFAIMSKIIDDPPPALPHHIPFKQPFRDFVACCLKKQYKERPKYRSLMNMEFFLHYDVPPYDVRDWLQGLPLDHLHHRPNHDYSVKAHASPDARSCNSIGSANSVITLSPVDNHKALSNLSLDDSIEFEPLEGHGSTIGKMSIAFRPNPPNVFCSTVSNKPALPPRATLLKTLKRDSMSSLDPISQASSGYGSVASEHSPRLLPKAIRSVDRCCSEEIEKNNCCERFNGTTIGRIEENGRTTNNAMYGSNEYRNVPVSNGKVRRMVSEYPEQQSIHLNGRDKPVTHPNRPTKQSSSQLLNGLAHKPVLKVRSASVGAHLHRSPAQRWPVRPNVMSSKTSLRHTDQSVEKTSTLADRQQQDSHPLEKVSPQQYHHHYFEYYHRPVNVEKKPPMGKTLLTRHASLDARDKSDIPTSSTSRLNQRLPTHPLPRQHSTPTKSTITSGRSRGGGTFSHSSHSNLSTLSESTRCISNRGVSRANSSSYSNQSTSQSRFVRRRDISVQETDI